METHVNSTEHAHEENGQSHYMELVSELNSVTSQRPTNNVGPTQSQKKRRRFIPFKYHSKIFKASRKKRHVDDHRISTNSSSYASCKTYKKDSARSNASSHTYQDIEQCTPHIELERCNSIATEASFSDCADRRTLGTEVPGIRKASANNHPIIQYQMELPKKTGRHAKKYMVMFCMILVCAILSAAIASLFSTRSLRESLPSDVDEQLSGGQFLQQVLPNVSNENVMNRIRGLQNEVQIFANDTKITNKNNFEKLPSKKDMEDFSNKTKMGIDLLLRTLPNKTDFDIWKEESKKNSYRVIHAMRCKRDCLNRADGDYQSCYTCEGFITCSNGKLENRDCAQSYTNRTLYWDDFIRRCLFSSLTCDPLYIHVLPDEENNSTSTP